MISEKVEEKDSAVRNGRLSRSQERGYFWRGEAPEQLYDFDEGADLSSRACGYINVLAEPRYIV
jgi:hypothetical protein